jgi:imidazole glycerol phosphate synthase glutamine amidotransferase subunit
MQAPEVVVIRTGTANLASVLAALSRLGARARLSSDGREVAECGHVVLPGVGAFGAAMQQLQAHGLVEPIAARVRAGRPTLAICLGLQLLCSASDESPGVAGLGIAPGVLSRFPATVRVPQLGWNQVVADKGCSLLTDGYACFANSYRLEHAPEGWQAASAEYGGRFVAAMEKGAVLACQFHPELSGRWGLELLGRWLATSDAPEGG